MKYAPNNPDNLSGVLQPVGVALDRGAWLKLRNTHADLAAAVEAAVAAGAQPEEIRRYVIQHTERTDLGAWVEQAARWLAHEMI